MDKIGAVQSLVDTVRESRQYSLPEPRTNKIEKPYKMFPPYPAVPPDYRRQLEMKGVLVDEYV